MIGILMSADKVYKKRPHRKVKSGCTVCKRRRIKCDEAQPQCLNCQRYWPKFPSGCVYPAISIEDECRATISPPDHCSEGADSDLNTSPATGSRNNDLAIGDLRLMHQWSTVTCYGFGDDFPGEVDPWRDDLPVFAQRFPFLLRAILAVSALHLACDSDDEAEKLKYIHMAACHQDLALPEYRRTLAEVDKDSAVAVLAFSALLVVHSFAAPKVTGLPFTPGLLEWFFLHRGVERVPAHWRPWVADSFLSMQMHRRSLQNVDPGLNPDDFHLQCLHGMISDLPADQGNDGPVYIDTLDCLRQAFAHTCNPGSRVGPKYAVLFCEYSLFPQRAEAPLTDCMLVIERVPQRYMDLLGSRAPPAMVFLAFICVLLKRASHFWYFEGFAERVLTEIRPTLGKGLARWIEWPLRYVIHQ
ncbi:hypothetical protein P280DRAFT_66375 [Massarina eburnea CBS 473.64]|uniref:Zn(2)-C6 fungal-type domain-containing protein n=1 Tax=Massarina eburnea CBS 473.64 TaxID=1395130 RepID=A0A6A6RWT4_9PLEO|nr:hypothetical protein P280DRAFT_66375 [Massarina eburnea CBS 473.64]